MRSCGEGINETYIIHRYLFIVLKIINSLIPNADQILEKEHDGVSYLLHSMMEISTQRDSILMKSFFSESVDFTRTVLLL